MDSIFLAKLLGIYYLAVGISRLLNKQMFIEIKDNIRKNVAVIFYKRVLILLFGAYVVITHNVWAQDWRTLITIIGWACLIKGALLIIRPNMSCWCCCSNKHSTEQRKKRMMIRAIIMTVLGIVLAYFGFFVQ